jgi:uncharacterized damage-inducible protein DinB
MAKENIIELLKKSFHGPAWHGPAVMEALADITPATAAKNISGSHSISELVMHMAAWRDFVSNRLVANNSFEVTEATNFPNGTDWAACLKTLQESQQKLISALNSFPENRMGEIVPTRKYDYFTMLNGIIQHDIYHTGQIVLIKKAHKTPVSSI